MSRYNSKYSGSQIDGAISYVLNGYPLAVGTGSLKASGSVEITGSLDITGSFNFKGKPILILSTSNFMSVYDNSDSLVIMNVGKNPFPVYGVVFNAGDITQENNGTQISLSDYQKEIDLTSLGIVKLGDTNGTTTKLIVDVVRSKVDITGSLKVKGTLDVSGSTQLTGSLNVSGSIEPISGSSLILLSPDGTRFKLTVDNSGVVSASLA